MDDVAVEMPELGVGACFSKKILLSVFNIFGVCVLVQGNKLCN